MVAPIHRWMLDNNALDYYGTADATATDLTYSSVQRIDRNYSALFNGSTSKLNINSIYLFSYTNFSLSFWVKCPPTNQKCLFSNTQSNSDNDRIQIHSSSGSAVGIFYVNSGGVALVNKTTGFELFNNKWNNVVLTDSNGTFKLYVNGKADQGCYGSYVRFSNTTDYFNIGMLVFNAYVGYKYNGYMDDVRLYDVALTAAEARELYNSYFTEKAASLAGFIG